MQKGTASSFDSASFTNIFQLENVRLLNPCPCTSHPGMGSHQHTHKSTIDRTQRVKAARTEAQKEIDDYRKQKEEEFQRFEKEVNIHPFARRALPFPLLQSHPTILTLKSCLALEWQRESRTRRKQGCRGADEGHQASGRKDG